MSFVANFNEKLCKNVSKLLMIQFYWLAKTLVNLEHFES